MQITVRALMTPKQPMPCERLATRTTHARRLRRRFHSSATMSSTLRRRQRLRRLSNCEVSLQANPFTDAFALVSLSSLEF